jgi:hypothetical protein
MLAAAVIVAFVALMTAGDSPADGDPASDYLLMQNIFFPYQPPSPAASAALEQATDGVYLHGDRIKVALISDVGDLGSLPSMFGRPTDYARFLGIELSLWYVGPLLVVMPAGFGMYDGGRSTATEDQVLGSLGVSGGTPDDLARAATAAVADLTAADALTSRDVRAPLVTAHPASARRGSPTTLHFDVFDDSGRSRAVVRIYEKHSLLATLAIAPGFKIGTRAVSVRWHVPSRLRSRQLRFCVVASDSAGNRAAPACAPFLRVE